MKRTARRHGNANETQIAERHALDVQLDTIYVPLQQKVPRKTKVFEFSKEKHNVTFAGEFPVLLHITTYVNECMTYVKHVYNVCTKPYV